MNTVSRTSGFTLIELVLVLGIVLLLTGVATINLIRPQQDANLDSAVGMLISDLRRQQNETMSGSGTTGSGIYFTATGYTLFRASTYSSGLPGSVTVNTPGVLIVSAFPAAQILFSRPNGEVADFSDGLNTITLSVGSQSRVITINKIGVPSVQ